MGLRRNEHVVVYIDWLLFDVQGPVIRKIHVRTKRFIKSQLMLEEGGEKWRRMSQEGRHTIERYNWWRRYDGVEWKCWWLSAMHSGKEETTSYSSQVELFCYTLPLYSRRLICYRWWREANIDATADVHKLFLLQANEIYSLVHNYREGRLVS